MKRIKAIILMLAIQLAYLSNVQAGDFSWLERLAVDARLDPSGISTRISTRFNIDNALVDAVITDVGSHAEAYMVLRLGELSHMPIDTVIQQYNVSKDRGWGVIAKQLGIKPGSREFHALKLGHDLNDERKDIGTKWKAKEKNQGHGKSHGKGHGQGKGRGKSDGKWK